MSYTIPPIVREMRTRHTRTRAEESAVKGTDLHLMRASNRLLILNCVREHGSITRAAIARQTGLSRTTVSSIMDQLLKEGYVRDGETQRASASGGRRVVPVHFQAAAGCILGVALGRNHLTILVSDLAATILKETTIPFETSRGADFCIPLLAEKLRSSVAEQHISWGKVVGVGMGMPGPLDAQLQGPAAPLLLPGWEGVNVRKILSAELGVPVYLDNNANMGALGESRYGAGHDAADLLYLKVGTGIGGGIVMGGQVYRGRSGSAGEIGHMTVDPNGPICNCGNPGCLEALVGGRAIVADARQAISLRRRVGALEGDAQVNGSKVIHLTTVAQVVQAAFEGDPACRAAIEQAGEYVGIALASLVNFFNPSLIVLDGNTMRAGEMLLEPIRRTVAARSLPAPLANTQIVPGILGGNAIALGGVATVIDLAFSPNPSSMYSVAEA